MLAKRTAIARAIATLITVFVLVAAVPQTALADEESGIWSQWVAEVADRSKPEIPIAILFSLPAMIVSTPFWLGQLALDKMRGDD
jgi:hypothetical protein